MADQRVLETGAGRALVLHSQSLVADLIGLALNHGVFVVQAAGTLSQAETILAEWKPQLVVIDMDHPDSTPFVGRLKAGNGLATPTTPALGLTRRGDLKTKLRAFDLGVDDIITMPFSPEELLVRAIVISRRATGLDRPLVPTIAIGEIEIDVLRREVRTDDTVIRLTSIEQSLLYLFVSCGGQVLTGADILDAIWGADFVTDSRIVDRHIRSLRAKLQSDYWHPRFIATVPGRGYRFTATFASARADGIESAGVTLA